MMKPKAWKQGSRVAVVAPCSSVKRKSVDRAEQAVRDFGLQPVMYPSCYAQQGYLAGADIDRAADIQQAFEDDSIEGVIALRGGYGSARLLRLLDFDMIGRNPKIFLGYSDVTALHIALNQICGLVTFHGVMAAAWSQGEGFTMESLRRHTCTVMPAGLVQNPPDEAVQCIVPGLATGRMTGGNLSIIASTLGSPYEIDTRGKILLIEEVGEALYRVDRMLMSLDLAGKFKDAAGVILGTWKDCQEEEDESGRSLSQAIEEIIVPHQKPLINNFRAGHVSPQITVPLGACVKLDAGRGQVEFLEAGCC